MKRTDIRAGVVYAYQRSTYNEPQPIVFLNAPADGVLYCETSHYRAPGSPAFIKARADSKPHRVQFGSDVGYPVVRLRWDSKDDPASLLSVTLADFEAATGSIDGGREFAVVVSLAAIAGPWSDVKAARDEQVEADRQLREHERAEADASRARAIDVLTALRARDIEPERISPYGKVESIVLPLEEAEKLLAMLRDREG